MFTGTKKRVLFLSGYFLITFIAVTTLFRSLWFNCMDILKIAGIYQQHSIVNIGYTPYEGYANYLISRKYIPGYQQKVWGNTPFDKRAFIPCQVVEHNSKTDLEYVIEVIEGSPVYESPFKSAMYFCEVLPWHLAHKIRRQFWPVQLLDPLKKKSTLGYSQQHFRWRKELELLLTLNTTGSEILRENKLYPGSGQYEGVFNFEAAVKTFTTLRDILFSEAFERALFKRLGVVRRYKSRDFRIQIDKSDFATGVHPDRLQKIATLQFYVPFLRQEVGAVWKYGTNLHTVEQFKKRNKRDGMASAYAKMLFLPNTAYAFRVHATSYHSVSLYGGGEGDRLTFMLNWYSDEKSGTMKVAQKW